MSDKTVSHDNIAPSFTPPKVTDDVVHRLADVFKVLADKSRLKIILALSQDGELHVKALCDLLGQSQPAVSHHLTLMRRIGLVGFRRHGKNNFYSLAPGQVRALLEQFFAAAGNSQRQVHFQDFALTFGPR